MPANVAAATELVIAGAPVVALAKPEPVTRTEVPAGPEVGERVTVGAVIVKVIAGGAAVPSEICTEC